MSFNLPYPTERSGVQVRGIINQVYAWMCAGLLITGAVASYTAGSEALRNAVFGNPWILGALLISQIGLVIGISWGINRLSSTVATALFALYSALTGLTMASVFLVYTSASIASTFFITAGAFAGMSAIGYFTKRDLSGMGRFLLFALLGLLLATLVNIFMQSSGLYWLITFAGILIFAGLTAYDTQKIKHMAEQAQGEEQGRKVVVLGALTLYLDFINMFLYLLRIFGDRR